MPNGVPAETLILVNPHGVSLRRSAALREVEAAAGVPGVTVVHTEYAGHARQYCRQHAGQYRKVISVGGDGMLMDVVNGVLGTDVAVAALPAGTACDFVKAMPGYPARLENLLASNEDVRIDLGRVDFADGTSQHFVTEAGVGMDAATVSLIPAWLRRIRASWAYNVGAIRAILAYQPYRARVLLDGEALCYERLQLLAVCNAKYFGDGMPIAPDAQLDDGRFHVFSVGDASRLDVLKNFASLRKGTHIHHPRATYRACRRVEIEADVPLAMCFDGDLVERTPRCWEIEPGRLRVVVPSARYSNPRRD